MKQFTLSLFLLASIIFSFKSKAADHVTMSIQNATSTSNTIEFDVFIVNDGTTQLNLGGYQFGINFASSILGGGTPGTSSYTYLAGTRDPLFAGLTNPSVQYNNQQLKVVSTTVPSVNAVALPYGIQMSLGRFRFTNTISWYPLSLPNLQFQLNSAAGKTQCVAICFVGSSPTSTTMNFANNNLNGISSDVVGFILNVPLPVQISSFTGSISGTEDILTWTTEQEENNSHFNLQFSTDGITFSTIAKLYSKANGGNSSVPIDYIYYYNQPSSGHNYYRLEQVDIDGKATIETEIVDLNRSYNSMVSFYPNPASNVLNVSFNSEKAENIVIKITDLNGKIIKHISSLSMSGNNVITFDLNDISSGNYFIQVYKNSTLSFTGQWRKTN